MSIKDRRKKGVTFLSVLRAARELSEDAEFDPQNKKEFSEKILEKIISKKLVAAKSEEPEIDWNGLLEFIERILPLILQILAIF